MLRAAALATGLAAMLLSATAASAESVAPGSVAFFGITFLDTSTEGDYFGERPEETARIDLLEEEARQRFSEEGFTFVDTEPVAEELDRIVNPADCYGCEIRMARKLDADYVLVGEVQKVSNLILSMNLVLRETAEGAMVRGQSVEIRSNTDDSWLRGIRYIMKNNIFKEGGS
jgi:hypothetical protein